MNKKLLSLLLALVMVFSFIPAFAAEEAPKAEDKKEAAKEEVKADDKKAEDKKQDAKEVKEEEVKDAKEVDEATEASSTPEFIKFLVDNGYIEGRGNDDLALDGTLTRAELTKLLVHLYKAEDAANGLKNVGANFSDLTTSHWANGYIVYARDKGWVKGYPDGTFKPNAPVTYNEAITVITRIVAQEKLQAKEAAGEVVTFPATYLSVAFEEGLLKDVTVEDYKAQAVRQNVFQVLYNAIQKQDLGNFTVLKMLVIENERTAPLKSSEIKAEVMSVVQRPNNVREDAAAYSKRVVGTQMVFDLNRETKKSGLSKLGDPENLLGKVITATVNDKEELVKVEIDGAYKYHFGPFAANDKRFEIDNETFNVRVDEKYRRSDDRYDSSDRRVYRTYVTKGSRAENYHYVDFLKSTFYNDYDAHEKEIFEKAKLTNKDLKLGDRKENAAGFARVTTKDGYVIFVDAFAFNDIAPVKETKNDGRTVYFYDDVKKGAVASVKVPENVIGYKADKGFYVLPAKEITSADVIHMSKDFFIVRQDAEVKGKVEDLFRNRLGDFIKVDGKEYFLNAKKDMNHPFVSLFGRDKYMNIIEDRYTLSELKDKEITAYLDVKNSVQFIKTDVAFTDGVALVKDFVYPELGFFAPVGKDDYKLRWAVGTVIDFNTRLNTALNRLSTSALTGDLYNKYDLVYTIAGAENFAAQVRLIAPFAYYKEAMKPIELGYRSNMLKWNNMTYRVNEDTDIFVFTNANTNDPFRKLAKATYADVAKYLEKNKLQAYILDEGTFAEILKDKKAAGQYRYNKNATDKAKIIVFKDYNPAGAKADAFDYGIVEWTSFTGRIVVRLGNNTTREFQYDDQNTNPLRAGQKIRFGIYKADKEGELGELELDKILSNYSDFDAVGKYEYDSAKDLVKVDGKEYYTDGSTRVFGAPSTETPWAMVATGDSTAYPRFAEAIFFVKEVTRDGKYFDVKPFYKDGNNNKALTIYKAEVADKEVPVSGNRVFLKDTTAEQTVKLFVEGFKPETVKAKFSDAAVEVEFKALGEANVFFKGMPANHILTFKETTDVKGAKFTQNDEPKNNANLKAAKYEYELKDNINNTVVKSGKFEVTGKEAAEEKTKVVDVTPEAAPVPVAPNLEVTLTNLNVADEATVVAKKDGKEFKLVRDNANKTKFTAKLEEGVYEIVVTADKYDAVPSEHVMIEQGKTALQTFTLTAKPVVTTYKLTVKVLDEGGLTLKKSAKVTAKDSQNKVTELTKEADGVYSAQVATETYTITVYEVEGYQAKTEANVSVTNADVVKEVQLVQK